MNVFFLKQVISALMISVNLHYFSSIHCLLAFSTNQFITHWRLKRRKTYERLVLSFYIVSFVLNVIVFVRNGLKQTKPNRLFQIPFFHRNLIYVYLKKNILRRMWRDLGMWVCNYINHIRLYLLFWFANFHYTYKGHIPRLTRKNKADKVCIYKSDHSILS